MSSKDAQETHVEDASRSPSQSDFESNQNKYTMKDHWKCLVACTLVSMCPFQYGITFANYLDTETDTSILTCAGTKDSISVSSLVFKPWLAF